MNKKVLRDRKRHTACAAHPSWSCAVRWGGGRGGGVVTPILVRRYRLGAGKGTPTPGYRPALGPGKELEPEIKGLPLPQLANIYL